jgi:hypothetical protein
LITHLKDTTELLLGDGAVTVDIKEPKDLLGALQHLFGTDRRGQQFSEIDEATTVYINFLNDIVSVAIETELFLNIWMPSRTHL